MLHSKQYVCYVEVFKSCTLPGMLEVQVYPQYARRPVNSMRGTRSVHSKLHSKQFVSYVELFNSCTVRSPECYMYKCIKSTPRK